MTARTSEKLAQVLENVGLAAMAEKARADYYHDYLSPLATPEMQLEEDLRNARDNCPDADRRQAIEMIRLRHIHEGEFDASKEESDDWAKSPEGQAAFSMLSPGARKLIGGDE